jgi:hypothetical protein
MPLFAVFAGMDVRLVKSWRCGGSGGEISEGFKTAFMAMAANDRLQLSC